ncbi:NF038130 family PEP-CTERM protein [Desertifilum sp. FACHB-1129]|uniref:PEP-CTERM protein-sorting domain-containing protein n=1 Tax=Desertifilum tharense IPPAS B-1220 TaxID=1781255 RepID=A0A1E5QGV6_9CYAN|nr:MULTISPECIES: NF038130 family PEP-CTERM protein [Desertifilum]MDA0211866.1 NF038130 family PEP-CTERM protein [Cyanobacteria bacterium FC1]MBD2314290.1 NF038130 family PEP-CTERM protein [Desertifilum sp. FACHB-1129]MBD2320393.1 NF038130 family PEP-CTERM protein [Desertifilum sp. FACHB-866]MBD2330521.1 NF038130 family PEP-CTERM protein [Desertifilum sp. FACHB-868]OEJ73824.1 hypothetical protein BH720_17105 [Desertifilum tharense IPPAS B-1220]
MLQTAKRLAIGVSAIVGVSAIAVRPASAFTISGTDYLLYDTCSPTTTCLNPGADLNSILAGNSSNPGGNIELFASSESLSNTAFLSSIARTSISGTVGGKTLTLSSLTADDWFNTGSGISLVYGAANLANTWFDDFLSAAGKGGASLLERTQAFNAFLGLGGFQRSSDPNISYVTTEGSDIKIGLAGHFDLKAYYTRPGSPFAMFAQMLPSGFQASEVVKANYDGVTKFLYSFSATESGLTNSAGVGADGSSHSGNYEVALRGVVTPPPPTADVPEPSALLGLAAVGGLFAAKRKLKNA